MAKEPRPKGYPKLKKAVDILEGRRVDPTFYPVVYGLKDDEDWEDEANWYKVNPSFIDCVNTYIQWYSTKRIKLSLGGMSPLDYRKALGYAN